MTMTNKLITYKRILCPVDYSVHSIAAVNHAISITAKFGGRIILLNVFELPGATAITGVSDEVFDFEKKQLEDFARTYSIPDLDVQLHVNLGHIGKEIIDTAIQNEADLIVMGSHGYSGLQRMLLGSTAEYILEHCKIPTLIIRT
jgi:nucleotide-binding universal stress UspA family protein